MKRAVSILFSYVLAVGLSLFGPLGMAAASQSSAAFPMEICADGTSKTIFVDFEGAPVTPPHDCHDCLACSHAMAGALRSKSGTGFTPSPLASAAVLTHFDTPYIPTDNIRPMPLGPPLGHIAMKTMSDLINADQAFDGRKTHGNGQPLFKDARA